MGAMSTVMIILVLVVVILAATGAVLGRISHKVESARDTEYVELEGHWIRYSVMGSGPPVVLVHGWLSSSRIWEQLARRLAQRFTVYTLDLVGFGESDKPSSGYGVRHGSRLLYAFCAHFGLTRTAVIGHDLSGAMAVKLATDYADVVGRLVLVATPADEEQIDLPTLLWLTTLPVVGPLFYSLGRLLKPVRKLWVQPFVYDPRDLPEQLVEDVGKSTPAAVGQTLSATRHEISGGRLARQSRIIKVPMLLVAGEDDQITDPRAVSDWGEYTAQSEILLLDGCGHLPMVEMPSEFSSRILAFLTGDNRYLEYVKEAPQPVEQEQTEDQVTPEGQYEREEQEEALESEGEQEEPPEEPLEEQLLEEQPPEAGIGESESPEAERAVMDEEEGSPVKKSTNFGDVSWDFSSRRSSKSRGDRRPAPPPGTGEMEDSERSASQKRQPDSPRSEVSELRSSRVPEVPKDLFQWSRSEDESGSGRRYSDERQTEGEDGDEEE